MPTTIPSKIFDQRRDELEKYEQMLGTERGRLAVTLDVLTDALVLVGQHGVYCISNRNPTLPALDIQAVVSGIEGAKELIQSTMALLQEKREGEDASSAGGAPVVS